MTRTLVFAGTSTFNITVRAKVPTFTSITVAPAPNASNLNISDASNELVNLTVGTITIRSNSPNGFTLSFSSLNNFILFRRNESVSAPANNPNFFQYALQLSIFGNQYKIGANSPCVISVNFTPSEARGARVTGNITASLGIIIAGGPSFGIEGPKFVAFGDYRDRVRVTLSAL